jgi:hypothetical protein
MKHPIDIVSIVVYSLKPEASSVIDVYAYYSLIICEVSTGNRKQKIKGETIVALHVSTP